MKSLICLSLALNVVCLSALWYLHATEKVRMQAAAVEVILQDAERFYQQAEAATIEYNKDKFNHIYEEMGIRHNSNPSSISEMMKPLVEMVNEIDLKSVDRSNVPAQQDESSETP